jgi:hypothetical protein
MNYKEIISVSNKSGLYIMHKKRNDGLIIKSIVDDSTSFASSRMHTFTPLENITIYTKNEPIELYEVFKSIKNNISKNPLPSVKAKGDELRSFFEVVLPEYDDEKVYTSDIVKIIKMFSVLDSKGLISLEDKVDSEAQSETTKENKKAKAKVEKDTTETKEVAPKKAKATKKKDA